MDRKAVILFEGIRVSHSSKIQHTQISDAEAYSTLLEDLFSSHVTLMIYIYIYMYASICILIFFDLFSYGFTPLSVLLLT